MILLLLLETLGKVISLDEGRAVERLLDGGSPKPVTEIDPKLKFGNAVERLRFLIALCKFWLEKKEKSLIWVYLYWLLEHAVRVCKVARKLVPTRMRKGDHLWAIDWLFFFILGNKLDGKDMELAF